jgi:Predicted signal-transduction protein containing cAMP-binding and CBS domains
VARLGPGASLSDAASLMRVGGFGSVAVCEADRLIGILTETDLVRAIAARRDPSSTTVSDYMSRDPVTADLKEDSVEVAERMASNGFRHLPVVEHGRLIGMVSARDLLRLVARPATRRRATSAASAGGLPPGAVET